MLNVTEGWNGDNYITIFSDHEREEAAERYGVKALLPGFHLMGLLGWDEFIVRSETGKTFKVPTVPCLADGLEPYGPIPTPEELILDERFTGKVKWYLQPIIFGGDPSSGDNLTWVSLDQHAELVRWWNAEYRTARQE